MHPYSLGFVAGVMIRTGPKRPDFMSGVCSRTGNSSDCVGVDASFTDRTVTSSPTFPGGGSLPTGGGDDEPDRSEEARFHEGWKLGVDRAFLAAGDPAVGTVGGRIGLDPVEVAAGEALGFGQQRVAVEPVGPEVGDADLELVFAGLEGIGDLDPVRRQPNESELLAVQRDLGDFGKVNEVYAAKGKKVVYFNLKKDAPSDDELAKVLLGPTGNLRAPTLRKGKTLVVGFNEETYEKLFC